MSSERSHSVTTTDGVTIGGRVHGEGSPLVFVHGMLADGDTDWQALLPHLTGRFTCYMPSYRGRGLSGDHPDLSPGRMVEDILAYVDSIEAPIGLVGWSSGAYLVVTAAAAKSDAVDAVAPIEPGVLSLMDEQEQAVSATPPPAWVSWPPKAGCRRRLARLLAGPSATKKSPWPRTRATLRPQDATSRTCSASSSSGAEYEGPTPDDPAVLGAISTPLLVLHGADTKPFLTVSARYVADHVPNARVQAIPGAGHAAPLTHPETLAEALTEFFAPAA